MLSSVHVAKDTMLLIDLIDDFIFYIPLPQQKRTLPQPFGDENYLCIAAVRNDMRLLGDDPFRTTQYPGFMFLLKLL